MDSLGFQITQTRQTKEYRQHRKTRPKGETADSPPMICWFFSRNRIPWNYVRFLVRRLR
jgi:hypothetical protein